MNRARSGDAADTAEPDEPELVAGARHQLRVREINRRACRRRGQVVVRHLTGGGALGDRLSVDKPEVAVGAGRQIFHLADTAQGDFGDIPAGINLRQRHTRGRRHRDPDVAIGTDGFRARLVGRVGKRKLRGGSRRSADRDLANHVAAAVPRITRRVDYEVRDLARIPRGKVNNDFRSVGRELRDARAPLREPDLAVGRRHDRPHGARSRGNRSDVGDHARQQFSRFEAFDAKANMP